MFLYCFVILGDEDEKGKVMGIFRSLGALSRALGPFVALLYCSILAVQCLCVLHGWGSSLPGSSALAGLDQS